MYYNEDILCNEEKRMNELMVIKSDVEDTIITTMSLVKTGNLVSEAKKKELLNLGIQIVANVIAVGAVAMVSGFVKDRAQKAYDQQHYK